MITPTKLASALTDLNVLLGNILCICVCVCAGKSYHQWNLDIMDLLKVVEKPGLSSHYPLPSRPQDKHPWLQSFSGVKKDLKCAEPAKAEGGWTFGEKEGGREGDGKRRGEWIRICKWIFSCPSGSVAIDLVSEWSSPPVFPPAARPTACICVLSTNRCQGAGSQRCINLELHWSLLLIWILITFHRLNL